MAAGYAQPSSRVSRKNEIPRRAPDLGVKAFQSDGAIAPSLKEMTDVILNTSLQSCDTLNNQKSFDRPYTLSLGEKSVQPVAFHHWFMPSIKTGPRLRCEQHDQHRPCRFFLPPLCAQNLNRPDRRGRSRNNTYLRCRDAPTSSASPFTRILSNTRARWTSAVFRLMPRSAATSLVALPLASSQNTSRSRVVSRL